MKFKKSCNRFAFTVLELLVVIAVIGTLASLVLPAIQSAREATRRMTCGSNMRQIGIAIESFRVSNRTLPAGAVAKEYPEVPQTPWTFYRWSTLALLTPYLEGTLAYNALDLTKPLYSVTYNVTPENAKGVKLRLPIFFCPNDRDQTFNGSFGPTNYAVCTGTGIGGGTPFETDGLFYVNSQTIDSAVSDGMSNTVLLSESLLGSRNAGDRTVKRSYKFTFSAPLTDASCRFPLAWNYTDARGFSWANGEYRTTLYNHYFAPNSAQHDCMSSQLGGGPDTKFSAFGWRAARSNHLDCVNVLLGDSSLHTVNDNIDISVWRAYATRNGAEDLPELVQ